MAITHSKVSVAADTSNTTNVRPSDWNADYLGTNEHDHTDTNSGGTIAHTDLTSIGTNTHAQIDTFITESSASIVALQTASVVSGSQSATLVDVDGSAIDLLTGTTGITGFIVNGFVSGSNINNFKVVNSGSNLLITSASPAYVVSVDDVYNWIVF